MSATPPLLILFSLFHFLSRRLDIMDVIVSYHNCIPKRNKTVHVHVLTRGSTAAYVHID